MKRKMIQLFIMTCILGLVLVGCNNNNNNSNGSNANNNNDDGLMNLSSLGSTGESSEDMSSKEVDDIIEKLVKVTAEKFSMSEDEYLEQVKKNGKTAKEEFELAADVMGISLKEYYNYEKVAVANMSEEAKENNQSLANALSQIEDLDLDVLESEAKDVAEDMLNALNGGGDRIVEGDVRELCNFKVDEVIAVEDDTEYGTYSIEYNSEADFEVIYEYYKELLEGTPQSMIIKVPGIDGASLMGSIDGVFVGILIDNEDGDDITNVMIDSYE